MSISKAEIYKSVVETLEDMGYEASFREAYSGRGMYGKTTPAIVTDAPAAIIGAAIFAFMMEEQAEESYEVPSAADMLYDVDDYLPKRSDNMGMSMVYY